MSLEDEFKVMKNNKETDKDKVENCFTKPTSFNIDDIKCSSSTPKDVKEKTKDEIKEDLPTCKVSLFKFGAEVHNNESEKKTCRKKKDEENDFKCDTCDYKAKKLNTLRKHINSKHTEQKCKVCVKEFKNAMQLISHVANDHVEEEESSAESHSLTREEGKN